MSSPAPAAVRTARQRLMQIAEPQDAVAIVLVAAFGPERALAIAEGRDRPSPAERREAAEAWPEHARSLTEEALEQAVRRWQPRVGLRRVEALEETLARHHGAWFACPEDADWPEPFQDLGPAQPWGLWGRGQRQRLSRCGVGEIAFVGSRDATGYGTAVTSHLAGDLAAEGYGILSGGAFGIDAAAHRAALATSVRDPATVCFLACGIDRFYPRRHEDLLREIADRGLVLTEVPPGCSPMRHRFLQRNRLIAGLAEVIVVVEAGWRSGALNTAHHGLEWGRTVAAVPGSVFSAQSAGCHRLLRDEPVSMVTSTRDLRELIGSPTLPGLTGAGPDPLLPMPGPGAGAARAGAPGLGAPGAGSAAGPGIGPGEPDPRDGLDEVQRLVLEALPVARAVPADRLCAVAGLAIRQVLPSLSVLEGRGLAQRREDGTWRLHPASRTLPRAGSGARVDTV